MTMTMMIMMMMFVCLFVLFLLANAGERLEIGDRSAENKRMNVVSA